MKQQARKQPRTIWPKSPDEELKPYEHIFNLKDKFKESFR